MKILNEYRESAMLSVMGYPVIYDSVTLHLMINKVLGGELSIGRLYQVINSLIAQGYISAFEGTELITERGYRRQNLIKLTLKGKRRASNLLAA